MTAYATSQNEGSNYGSYGNVAWAPTTFSFMAWIQITTTGTEKGFFARSKSAAPDYQFGAYVNSSNQVAARISLDGTTWTSIATNTSTTLSTGTWYLVIVTFDGSDLYVYVGDENGTAFTSGTVAASGTIPSKTILTLMAMLDQAGTSVFKSGKIDQLALWDNKVLSSAERSYCYGALGSAGDGVNLDYLQNDPDSDNPGAPTHYWKLDEDGGPYVDSIGSWDFSVAGSFNRVAGHVDEEALFGSGSSSEIIIRELMR